MNDLDFQELLLKWIQTKEDFSRLKSSCKEIGALYQNPHARFSGDQRSVFAYMAMRMPSTVAVLKHLLHTQELQSVLEIAHNKKGLNVFDFGCGPLSFFWALVCAGSMEKIGKLYCYDVHRQMQELGVSFAKANSYFYRTELLSDFCQLPQMQMDLLVAAYSFTELCQDKVYDTLDALLKLSPRAILLVEPGTKAGFSRLVELRKRLQSKDYCSLAPCSHDGQCPLSNSEKKWCHFSLRRPRLQFAKRVKSASCPYEDEKFSYVFMLHKETFLPVLRAKARIIDHPKYHRGHLSLSLCESGNGFGIHKQEVVSRKDKDLYRKAKKASWGERWDYSGLNLS